MDYRMDGAELSAKGIGTIRRMLKGEVVEQEGSGLSPREWRELRALLHLD
jgi:thymidylate synthase (FAD)